MYRTMAASPGYIEMAVGASINPVSLQYPELGPMTLGKKNKWRKLGMVIQLGLLTVPAVTHIIIIQRLAFLSMHGAEPRSCR